jgi:hypothetical protein
MTDPHTPADYTAADKSPAEIEADIRRTRAEMDETFDALGDRLHPDYLKEQAKDAIRDTARDAGSSMIDTLRDNPVPSLIAALSVGWLIAKGGRDDRREYDYDRAYGARYDRPYRGYGAYRAGTYADPTARAAYAGGSYASGAYDSDPSLGDRASDAANSAKASAQHAADQAGDAAHDAADRMGDAAHHAAEEARYYGRRAQNWLERQMDRNPLGVGAAALAAGALVGLAVPGTDWEDEQMGEQRDRLMRQAEGAIDEKLDQAKRAASEVADEAEDKARSLAHEAKAEARDLADTAKREADKKGLTDEPASVGTSASSGATATAKASDPRAGSGA